MRVSLTVLLLSFTMLVAETGHILPSDGEKPIGCKAVSFTKEKPSCSQKKSPKKRVLIAPIKISKNKKIEKIQAQLNAITKEFAKYKKEKESEIQKVYTQLNDITEQFVVYKIDEGKKIKKIKSQLNIALKELSKNKKRLVSIQKSSKKKRKLITKKVKVKREMMPVVEGLPWVEVVVEDGIDIYQLALKYYGDKKEYKQIYVANQNRIGKDFKIEDGMPLKIPMTERFEEQPMFLNRD